MSRATLRRWVACALLVTGACGDEPGDGAASTTAPFTTTTTTTVGDSEGSLDSSGGEGSSSSDGADASSGATLTTASEVTTAADDSTTATTDTGTAMLDPPEGGSSGGAGGGPAAGDVRMTADGIQYRIIAPGGGGVQPLMIVYSGTEGGATMTNNLMQVADFTGNGDCVFAVLDGVQYNGDGQAGVSVLDEVRGDYDIDNDRTYLLSESAGTTAGLELGLTLRQSYFAAYWANDVNASLAPSLDAATLGFAPFGNAGPGGQFADADAIVAGMDAAGYRTPEPSPYDGPGAGTHGDPDQFVAALQWFPGKTRQ